MKKKNKNIIYIVLGVGAVATILTLLFIRPAKETTEVIEEGATTTEKKGILSVIGSFFNLTS